MTPGSYGFLAMLAEFSDEALGEDADDRRADEIGLDADVVQTGDRAGSVVGVQGAEDQVAGEGGLGGELGGFGVADFADHDNVGVLPQQRAQSRRRNVKPAFSLTWNWLTPLRAYSIGSSTVQIFTSPRLSSWSDGVERGAFAAAGRAGDQQDAVGERDEFSPGLERVVAEAEFFEIDGGLVVVDDADDDFFAVFSGQGADAQIDGAFVHHHMDAAVLRQAALGDIERRP